MHAALCTHIHTQCNWSWKPVETPHYQRWGTQTAKNGVSSHPWWLGPWCDTQPLQAHCLNRTAYWCNTMAKTRWHNAMAISGKLQPVFSDKKKHLSLVPCSSQQLLGVKRVYSSHTAISQPDLRKCPFDSCHVFCDWQWIKFGENNCGSCCWPQVALNTVW